MNRNTLILIIFCIVLAGALYYLVVNHENSSQEIYNVSISAQYGKERVITGFELKGIRYNTSNSYELLKLQGGIIDIRNINLKNQNFYEKTYQYNITKDTRIDLRLEKPEEVEITTKGNNPLELTFYSKSFDDVDFCLDISSRYLFVKPFRNIEFYNLSYEGNFDEVEVDKYRKENWEDYHILNTFEKEVLFDTISKPAKFNVYEKCYDGNFSLKESPYTLNISYLQVGETSGFDQITIALIDNIGNFQIEKIK